MSRIVVAGAVGVLATVGLLVDRERSGQGAAATPAYRTATVLVLTRPVRAGAAIDPAGVRSVVVDPRTVPSGALTTVDAVAFRRAVVTIPPGLPLVPSLLRRAGPAVVLGPGERAVGVRVDDVAGLPSLLEAGTAVDVIIGGEGSPRPGRVRGAMVIARPRRTADGAAWAVPLRLPARLAERVAAAVAAGRDIRLLAGAGR
jgi:Flp pilus assembly protein CpaB